MPNAPRRGARRARPSDPALELRQLRAFVAVVDHGSVTAAAHVLGLAQSTVSEALAALERALGATVTVRRRGASDLLLTAAGHALVRDFFAADQMPGPPLESTGSVEGVKRGVAVDPRALGLLPVYAIIEDLRAGRVAPVDVRPAPPRMRLDALLSRSRLWHPAVTESLDAVRAAFPTAVRDACA